jgi:hypothetical protein
MKKGKFVTIGNYNNVRIGYGTVDSKNLKTIYIQLNSWTQPSMGEGDFNKIISKTRRVIKDKIYNLKSEFFKKESIVDLDIKTKGVKTDKRSFMDLEITLFVEKQFDVRSEIIKNIIKDLSCELIDGSLTDKSLFNFYEKKT